MQDKLFVQLSDCRHQKNVVWQSGIVYAVRCTVGHETVSRQRHVNETLPVWMIDEKHLSGVRGLSTYKKMII